MRLAAGMADLRQTTTMSTLRTPERIQYPKDLTTQRIKGFVVLWTATGLRDTRDSHRMVNEVITTTKDTTIRTASGLITTTGHNKVLGIVVTSTGLRQ